MFLILSLFVKIISRVQFILLLSLFYSIEEWLGELLFNVIFELLCSQYVKKIMWYNVQGYEVSSWFFRFYSGKTAGGCKVFIRPFVYKLRINLGFICYSISDKYINSQTHHHVNQHKKYFLNYAENVWLPTEILF